MKSRLFILLSSISLIIAVIILADRFTHFWRSNRIQYVTTTIAHTRSINRTLSITTGNGVIVFAKRTLNMASPPNYVDTDEPGLSLGPTSDVYLNARDGNTFFACQGFAVGGITRSGGLSSGNPTEPAVINSLRYFILPNWFLALLFTIPPIFHFRPFRRPLPPGLCPTCSYNLTGNQSGTCPECGTPIPTLESKI